MSKVTEVMYQDLDAGSAWVEIKPTGEDTQFGPELGLYIENTLVHTGYTYTSCAEALIGIVNY